MSTPANNKHFTATKLALASLALAIVVLCWKGRRATPPVLVDQPAVAEPVAAAQPVAAAERVTTFSPAPAPLPTLEREWGIQVLGLSLTNNDTSVNVSYTILDPEKTLLLGETNTMVYLMNQSTGTKLPMITPPPEGAAPQGANRRTIRRMMRQAGRFPPTPSRVMAGMTYSVEIPNWNMTLQRGSKVSFVVGDFKQDNLTVE